MDGLKNLVGRKFHFEQSGSGQLVPTVELPSATWFHPNGSVQPVECPTEATTYSKTDSEVIFKSVKQTSA